MKFRKGKLQRELDRRGMSQQDFARIAAVSADTIYRACKGENVRKASWAKILIALEVVPALTDPTGLTVAS